MLSLGNLAVGQAAYYLDQAHGSVTRTSAVSSGVEDYYLGGHEAPGTWMGAGAGALGLAGSVAAVPLDRVLCGEHPGTGAPLGRVLSARRPGFDLTFSAPKSVSVLLGVGDDGLRAVLRDAHDRAVADALGYMEHHAAVTRRGAGGVHAIAGNGLVAAAFRHRTSRAGDPHLHTHVLVANLTLGADGQWSTLDGRRIYAHAKTAGYLYEARLRSLLTRELGVGWAPARNGIADIAGVPPPVLRAFSRRRAEIEAELARRGASSAAAAQVAALATRRGKDYDVTSEQLVPEWRERAAQLGLTPEVVRGLRAQERSIALDAGLIERIAEQLAGPEGLTQQRSTFTRRDVLLAFCERLPAAADLRVRDVERLADAFLRSPRVVALATGERREPLRRRDGRVVPGAAVERTYSTPELLALERQILEYAAEGQGSWLGVARPRAIDRAIALRPSLSGEQVEMVRRLTTDGAAVAVVVGQAGAGKTFALGAARDAWEASGRRVFGAALARRAARELEETAGIPSTSVAALLGELDRRPYSTLPLRSVLVLDEAGMLPTRQLAQLVEHAQRLHVKLVLVGDHRQLPSIGAGGAFQALQARLPMVELRENRRQAHGWERDALALVRDGKGKDAIGRYEQAGRIVTGEDAGELRRGLVADWWAARDPGGALMIAQTRKDIDELNGRAHALMRATGALGADELTVGRAAFSVGDHVVARRNDCALGIVNGDRGTVVALDRTQGSIELALPGRQVALDRGYLENPTRHGQPALQHGYAITAHLAQGLTCRETFILATDQLTREAAYVALSRGRDANRLYVLPPVAPERDEYAPNASRDPEPRSALVDGLTRSQTQTLASDATRATPLATELGGDHAQRTRTATDLASVQRERQQLGDELAGTRAKRTRLEHERPPWFRPKARGRHVAALEHALTHERRAERRLNRLTDRESVLRKQLERERAARPRHHELDRTPGPARRLFREASRGIEL